ncbi:unnamed protein product [Caenorhabditis sp. 36 PRJEB53466]|nr:unnamed protein product [Caenorhabditis sp. 36 PRJEB53466]
MPSPAAKKVMEPVMPLLLNFRHIEKINSMVYKHRELSRATVQCLGIIGSTVVSEICALNTKITATANSIENVMIRNDRATFEKHLKSYEEGLQTMIAEYTKLFIAVHNRPPPPPLDTPVCDGTLDGKTLENN